MSTTHLMYHDIYSGTDKSSGFQSPVSKTYKVEIKAFEKQVKCCIDRDVIFTFDDGGDSFLNIIDPILNKYGRKGIFFISTKYIGTPGFLNASQIRELSNRGHLIGSHTHTHPKNLSSLSKEEIEREWTESKSILESILSQKVDIASIPNGMGSTIVNEAAKKAGFKLLYTSVPTNTVRRDSEIILVGRFVIHDKTSNKLVHNIVSHVTTRILLLLRWIILNAIQRILGTYYYKIRTFMAS